MPEQRFKVTVGMPVYNSEKWIRSSLESWLNQTMADFRIVISDNGSTDESVKICSSIAANDSRIEIYKNKQNIGISKNFRRAFEVGSGAEYFMWASSHDYFAPTMLQRCVSTLDKHPDAVACCGQTALFESDPTNAKPYIETIRTESHSPVERYLSIVSGLRVNNLVHGVFRTNALRDTRLMGDYFSSDNVLVAQLALAGRIIQLPETLFYRRWEASASTS